MKKYKKLSPKEQKEFRKKHDKQLAKAEELRDYFDSTLGVGEKIDLKQWKKDLGNLNTLKMISNWKCDAFKDELGRAELLRELVDELTKEQAQEQQRGKNRGQDR